MVKEKLKRVANSICVTLAICCVLMCCVFVPASAAINGAYAPMYNCLGIDTIVTYAGDLNNAAGSRQPFMGYAIGNITSTDNPNSYTYVEFEDVAGDTATVVFPPPVLSGSGEPSLGTYGNWFAVKMSVPGNNYIDFTLTNSTPFVLDMTQWDTFRNCWIATENTDAEGEYELNITLKVPVMQEDGSYEFWTTNTSYVERIGSNWDFIPHLDELWSASEQELLSNKRVVCTKIEINFSYNVPLPESGQPSLGIVTMGMPYATSQSVYLTTVDEFVVGYMDNVGGASWPDMTGFLASAVSGFWAFEVAPGLSLGSLVVCIIGIMIFISILHLLR